MRKHLIRNGHAAQHLFRILEELGDVRCPLRRRPRARLLPEQPDGADDIGKDALRNQPGQRLQKRRFAGTGGTEQQKALARADGHRHWSDRRRLMVGIANRDILPGRDGLGDLKHLSVM